MSLFFVVLSHASHLEKIITSDCVVFFFIFPFYRTILAALHFNYNLKRGSKVDDDGEPVLHVTYPKFKEGDATVKEASSNYGIYQYQSYMSQKLVSSRNALQ